MLSHEFKIILGNFNVPDATHQDESDNEEPPDEDAHFDVTAGFETSQVQKNPHAIPVFNNHLSANRSQATPTLGGPAKTDSPREPKKDSKDAEDENMDDETEDEEKIYAAMKLLPPITFGKGIC